MMGKMVAWHLSRIISAQNVKKITVSSMITKLFDYYDFIFILFYFFTQMYLKIYSERLKYTENK